MWKKLVLALATVALAATVLATSPASAAPRQKCDVASASQIEFYGAQWVRPVTGSTWVMTNEGVVPGPTNEPGESSPDLLETWEREETYGNGSFSGRLVLAGKSCPEINYRATVTTTDGDVLGVLTAAGDGVTGASEESPFVVAQNVELPSTDNSVLVRFEAVDKKGTVTDFAPQAGGYWEFEDNGGGGLPYLR